VFEDIGEQYVPDALNRTGFDADRIRRELEDMDLTPKDIQIMKNTIGR
jgi:hypothetical protein